MSTGLWGLRVLTGPVLTVLASCTVGPDYQAPQESVSAGFHELSASTDAGATSRTTGGPADLRRWWTAFRDPTLDSLIKRALNGNIDFMQAASRVRQARAQRALTAGGQYPKLDVSAAYNHQRFSGDGPFALLPKREFNLYEPSFDASWEADLFGGIRRRVEAADADFQAAVEEARDVQVSLVAEVARLYIEYRGFRRRRAIALENLATQRDLLGLTRERFRAGFVTQLDVSRQAAQVNSVQADIPALEASATNTLHALSILLGEEPGALSKELSDDGAIPPVPPEVPIGIPADLLRRRPDLRQSERRLAAATARVGEATADLYPRLSLSGTIGLQAASGGGLAHPGQALTDLAGLILTWPIFDGGTIRANIEVHSAIQEQCLFAYRQALLGALREVEDALTRYRSAQERRVPLADAVKENVIAVDLARDQYKQGLIDFLAVIDTERQLLSAQDALVQSEEAISATLVALYKALGGGWEDPAQGKY